MFEMANILEHRIENIQVCDQKEQKDCIHTIAAQFEAMVEFINKHKIIPVVDEVFKLNDINDAFLAMENAKQFGKIVLNSLCGKVRFPRDLARKI